MPLNVFYKLEFFNTTKGYWEFISSFPQELYHQAITELYNQYKWNNTRKYRLIQVKEELIDILYPPGS